MIVKKIATTNKKYAISGLRTLEKFLIRIKYKRKMITALKIIMRTNKKGFCIKKIE